MQSITLVLMFVLISVTADVLSTKKLSNYTKNVIPPKDSRPINLAPIRTTDHPNYDPMKDPYVYKILAKHHADRRARKLRKHKQKMKDNIDAVMEQKNKQQHKQKKQALKVFDEPGFQVNMTIRKALEAKRLRKLKLKMFEPVKAARRAKGKKQATWNNTANNVIDLSKYKAKGLRVHKSDFNGREYYSPYLAKLTLHSMFATM